MVISYLIKTKMVISWGGVTVWLDKAHGAVHDRIHEWWIDSLLATNTPPICTFFCDTTQINSLYLWCNAKCTSFGAAFREDNWVRIKFI